jgi:adenine-specific DNA-methyltransferase
MTAYEETLKDLVSKLKELFQMNQADLDFGIYRVMKAKHDEIDKFLTKDLLPTVKKTLEATGKSQNKQKELDEIVNNLRNAGIDPDTSPKVKELKALLENGGSNSENDAKDIFSNLITFFSRYYSGGDFMSLRRYKKDTYSPLSMNGEEVKLHWANADQYYIKSAESFKSYAFLVSDKGTEKRVVFELVNADTEKENKKELANIPRVFIIDNEQPFTLKNNDFVINFQYVKDSKKRKQKELNALALEKIKEIEENSEFSKLRDLLLKASAVNPKQSIAEKYLTDYTNKNSFDYFIHKNIAHFLQKELNHFIQNELLNLNDLLAEPPSALDNISSLIEKQAITNEFQIKRLIAFKSIALQIIQFLSQLENFQKRLWLKKKFIFEANYSFSLKILPDVESLVADVLENTEQHKEWEQLYSINSDELCHFLKSEGLTALTDKPEFAYVHIDTKHFSKKFKYAVLSLFDNLDDSCNGLLVKSDNYQALRLLEEKYREKVKCIYIDPPYNTGGDGFLYKDAYMHSSWLSMVYDRVQKGRNFIKKDGAIFASIDEGEHPKLRQVFDETWGEENFVADMVWAAGRKNDSRLISVSHEYMLVYAADRNYLSESKVEWRQKKKGLDDIYKQEKKLRKEFGADYVSMSKAMKEWYKNLADGHSAKAHKHYSVIDKKGLYYPDNISWPGGGGPKYDVLHPDTKKPVKVPSRGWMTSAPEKMQSWIADDLVHFGINENFVPCIKSYLKDREFQAPYSVFYQDGRAATKRLRHVMGTDDFGYPKDETVLSESIGMVAKENELVMDYFAGSGTTAHAIINLQREDKLKRNYILVEMGEHFDTIIKPRIKKITYTDSWKDGKPTQVNKPIEHMFKYMVLESYEDVLDNVVFQKTEVQKNLLKQDDMFAARADYLLNYSLDFESKDSVFNIKLFENPFDAKIEVVRDNAKVVQDIDLLETFNALLGLHVLTVRESKGILEIVGAKPDGDKCLIIWRDVIETANDQLDEWFKKQDYNSRDMEFDLIYVNGDNNLPNLKTGTDHWKVQLIETEFYKLMFDVNEL